MSDQVWWYATRAAGLMTWATATAAVVLGLLLSTRAVRNRTGPWFLDLHRFLGGISVVFLLAHVVTLWADSYVDFGPKEILIPGASEWKPEAIAWGIIAAYLLVAVEVTSLIRRRLSAWTWRAIHLSSFLAMAAGSYHAVTAGSDVDNPITWAIAGIGCMLVFFLVSMRLQRQDPDEAGPGGGIIDNRKVLEEMRQRLAELPVPENTAQPQLAPSQTHALPRRAPVAEDLPGIEAATPADLGPAPRAGGFSSDPFAAVPHPDDDRELGDWAEPSAADPFVDTGLVTSPEHWPEDGADLFEDLAGDPFDPDDPFARPAPADGLGVSDTAAIDPGVATPAAADPFASGDPLAAADDPFGEARLDDPPDLFGAAVSQDPSVDLTDSPFGPVDPPPSSITTEDEAVTPTAGPPPLPTAAVDPVTGEPDEAAYTEWLREWLAYAERYGDETPDDPTRV